MAFDPTTYPMKENKPRLDHPFERNQISMSTDEILAHNERVLDPFDPLGFDVYKLAREAARQARFRRTTPGRCAMTLDPRP